MLPDFLSSPSAKPRLLTCLRLAKATLQSFNCYCFLPTTIETYKSRSSPAVAVGLPLSEEVRGKEPNVNKNTSIHSDSLGKRKSQRGHRSAMLTLRRRGHIRPFIFRVTTNKKIQTQRNFVGLEIYSRSRPEFPATSKRLQRLRREELPVKSETKRSENGRGFLKVGVICSATCAPKKCVLGQRGRKNTTPPPSQPPPKNWHTAQSYRSDQAQMKPRKISV